MRANLWSLEKIIFYKVKENKRGLVLMTAQILSQLKSVVEASLASNIINKSKIRIKVFFNFSEKFWAEKKKKLNKTKSPDLWVKNEQENLDMFFWTKGELLQSGI